MKMIHVTLFAAAVLPVSAGVTLTPLWSVPPGTSPFPTTPDNNQRSIAFNPVTGNVLMVNRTGSVNINTFNGLTGAQGANLNVTGISGGTFALNCVACTDDGVVYAANLVSPSGNTRIYRWGEEGEAPVLVFDANIGGFRWGDNMDIRGTGNSTQIILGRGTSGNDVCVMTTTDNGLPGTWTATRVPITSLLGLGVRGGLCFEGDSNTFFSTAPNASTLYYSNFELAGPSGSNTDSSLLPAGGSGFTGLDMHSPDKLLAAIRVSTATTPPSGATALYLFDATDPNNPVVVASSGFPANNQNTNGAGRAVFGTTVPGHPLVVFALSTNSGLMARSVTITPDIVPPTVTGPDPRSVYLRGQTTLTATVSGTPPFTYNWTRDGQPVPGATTSSLVINPFTEADAGSYVCTATNAGGSASGPAAEVSALPSVNTDALTELWRLSPGVRPYLTTDDTQRGLDASPDNSRVYLVSRTPSPGVHVLEGTTGAHLHSLDVTGVTGGFFVLNAVAAADDGSVYACSLTTDASNVKVYRWATDAPGASPAVVYEGNAAGGRLGDNLDARGAGPDTQLVLGSRNQNAFLLLTGDPGAGPMNATSIVTNAPVNSFGLSATFGTGNTIWGKTNGNALVHCSYDLLTGTGTVLRSFGPAAGVPANVNFAAVDPATGLLAALQTDNSDNTRLYKLPDPADTGALVLCDQEFIFTDNPNPQATGALSIRGGKVFALNTGNGITAYSTTRPVAPEFGLISMSSNDNTITFRLHGTVGKTYLIEKSTDLANGSWTPDGTITLTQPEQPVVRSSVPGRTFFRAREN